MLGEGRIQIVHLTLSLARNVKNFGNSLCLKTKIMTLVLPELSTWSSTITEEITEVVPSYFYSITERWKNQVSPTKAAEVVQACSSPPMEQMLLIGFLLLLSIINSQYNWTVQVWQWKTSSSSVITTVIVERFGSHTIILTPYYVSWCTRHNHLCSIAIFISLLLETSSFQGKLWIVITELHSMYEVVLQKNLPTMIRFLSYSIAQIKS